ncbi:unnamed protein product [Cyprideis torosa]|uniref:Uncharacterized protein n=1 Tax=Cyprideis torosa TaxID=163714 RepID=A0A7R8W743_9CRUS|nr:unnamed protein product [Cyprideis torosa]CAG0887185.1 unnamed protein product [Cyprideis torosa]
MDEQEFVGTPSCWRSSSRSIFSRFIQLCRHDEFAQRRRSVRRYASTSPCRKPTWTAEKVVYKVVANDPREFGDYTADGNEETIMSRKTESMSLVGSRDFSLEASKLMIQGVQGQQRTNKFHAGDDSTNESPTLKFTKERSFNFPSNDAAVEDEDFMEAWSSPRKTATNFSIKQPDQWAYRSIVEADHVEEKEPMKGSPTCADVKRESSASLSVKDMISSSNWSLSRFQNAWVFKEGFIGGTSLRQRCTLVTPALLCILACILGELCIFNYDDRSDPMVLGSSALLCSFTCLVAACGVYAHLKQSVAAFEAFQMLHWLNCFISPSMLLVTNYLRAAYHPSLFAIVPIPSLLLWTLIAGKTGSWSLPSEDFQDDMKHPRLRSLLRWTNIWTLRLLYASLFITSVVQGHLVLFVAAIGFLTTNGLIGIHGVHRESGKSRYFLHYLCLIPTIALTFLSVVFVENESIFDVQGPEEAQKQPLEDLLQPGHFDVDPAAESGPVPVPEDSMSSASEDMDQLFVILHHLTVLFVMVVSVTLMFRQTRGGQNRRPRR